jgi:DNA recombination protein RmuC
VQKLLEDVERLDGRVAKLDAHFRQAQDDVAQIRVSTEKIVKRGQKIELLEFDEADQAGRADLLRLHGRSLRAVD